MSMKKKAVIVEDRPWVMERTISEMKKLGIDLKAMLLLKSNKPKDVEEQNRKFLSDNNIYVEDFDILTINEVLDKYYEDEDIILLLDLVLDPDPDIRNITERMTVRYADAKRKQDEQKAAKKIFFYTTAPEVIVNWLNEYFPNQVISVLDFENNMVVLDMEQIKEVMGVEG